MSGLFSKIAHFVHGAAIKVSDVFVKIFGHDAAHQFAQGALAILKSAEGKIVLDAVEAASTLAVDGPGKHAAAFAKIGADLKAEGKTLADSMINMLIEVAVQYAKGSFAPK